MWKKDKNIDFKKERRLRRNEWERQRDMTGAGSKQTESLCENKRADKKLLSPPLKLLSVSLDI